ncbi:MAG TPA: DUF1893 domain-containing protein [Spirochaetia bacterium]|nr:DUF1893 domain-containing protein [Spirochaetia bacterium]
MATETTLELIKDGEVLFASGGKWLHPLFELEQFLKTRRINPLEAEIRDKIVGRGSAFLILRLGFRTIHAGVLSRLGKEVLDRAGASCRWESLVDQIQCRTEGLLKDTTEPELAYKLLADLAARDRQRQATGEAPDTSAATRSSALGGGRPPAA